MKNLKYEMFNMLNDSINESVDIKLFFNFIRLREDIHLFDGRVGEGIKIDLNIKHCEQNDIEF